MWTTQSKRGGQKAQSAHEGPQVQQAPDPEDRKGGGSGVLASREPEAEGAWTRADSPGQIAASAAWRAARWPIFSAASQDNADPGPRAAALGKENSLNKSFWCLIN